MASLLLAAAISRTPPTFATEFGLDYTVTNRQYGFVAVGRWTVDHQNSSGSLNLRERTDSYNKTLQPRAEVKDYALFEPDGPCPPAPPPPPPPVPAHPWEPADDCSPQCSSYAAAVSCCKCCPVEGQEHGVCMKVSNCSDVGARELIRLRGAQ